MNIIIDLLQGVALLLALSLLQSFVIRLWPWDKYSRQIISGLLFGGLCVVGMMMPLELAPGLIFDARSVIVSMAAAFGGVLVGGISALVAILYRVWIGGVGAPVGVLTVIIALAVGLAFRRAHEDGLFKRGVFQFLVLGAIVHGISMVAFSDLQPSISPDQLASLTLPYLLIYSAATALLGSLLMDVEERHEMERALQVSEERYRVAYDSIPIAIVEPMWMGSSCRSTVRPRRCIAVRRKRPSAPECRASCWKTT